MAFVKTEVQGAVEIITIDRPKALNALNPEVLADLKAAFEAVDQSAIRCIVLTGEGDKSFVAGADIGSMSTMTKAEGEAFGKLGNDVFLMIESFPIPVIAAVNGFALGGGNELAMSCDIRICSDNAVFGQPEVGLGITPGFGGTQRLARLVGMGMAKQLVYSALNIKADEAYRIGLVNAVYPQAELMENVLKLANKIAKNAPIAVRNCKKAINDGISLPIEGCRSRKRSCSATASRLMTRKGRHSVAPPRKGEARRGTTFRRYNKGEISHEDRCYRCWHYGPGHRKGICSGRGQHGCSV